MSVKWWLTGLVGLFGAYTVWTYTLVDPNLVLSSQPFFLELQEKAWQLGYHTRSINTWIYSFIIVGLFGAYAGLLYSIKKGLIQPATLRRFWVGVVIVLAMSYPAALSHDIFNYLFNAKMVLVYGANPHTAVALDFAEDDWTRYMHNTHTPAPYGYGFSVISLVPSFLGQNHLKITIFLFRLLMITGLVLWLVLLWQLTPAKNRLWFWAVAFNPLVLIETVSSIHNDVLMMAPALGALLMFDKAKRTRIWPWGWAAVGLLALSISIKYASLMLIIGLAGYEISKRLGILVSRGGWLASAHFLPLLTARSQQFLPWYLIWPLTFVPLIKEVWLKIVLLVFSLSAMLSYIPYLTTGEYTPLNHIFRKLIVFVPPLLYLMLRFFCDLFYPRKNKV